ncbi:prolyl oligopeptidase family serine peptidase [Phenylobacterium sp.]|uniref:prolyl oligopeptidase family serine peptidase n=1 Tax=Phenylobacterium sp. TaxID=1871053 RepID=UPI0035261DE1
MFSALYRTNKDAELITVFGEGHIVSSPANLREVYRLALDWLLRVLRADDLPPPARGLGFETP